MCVSERKGGREGRQLAKAAEKVKVRSEAFFAALVRGAVMNI